MNYIKFQLKMGNPLIYGTFKHVLTRVFKGSFIFLVNVNNLHLLQYNFKKDYFLFFKQIKRINFKDE